MSELRWTDDHCHLHLRGAGPDEVAAAVADAAAAGVERLVTVGCDVDDSRAALEVAPVVAGLVARELGRDAAWAAGEVERFKTMARGYVV